MIVISLGIPRNEWHNFLNWLDDRYTPDGWFFQTHNDFIRKTVYRWADLPDDGIINGNIVISLHDLDRDRENTEFALIKMLVNHAETVGREPS